MSDKRGVSPDFFAMWRTIIAMAHADGIVNEDERAYLLGVFDNMRSRHGLTDEQHAILLSDLDTPHPVEMMMMHIKDPAARGNAITFARTMAMTDGVLDPSEEEILNRLHAKQMEHVDINTLRLEIQKQQLDARAQEQQEIAERRKEMYGRSLLSRGIDKVLLALGIDMLK